MEKRSRPLGASQFGGEELIAMASVLEGRHGSFAAEVAEFFSCTHLQGQDQRRGTAWARVADIVREREAKRIVDGIRFAE